MAFHVNAPIRSLETPQSPLTPEALEDFSRLNLHSATNTPSPYKRESPYSRLTATRRSIDGFPFDDQPPTTSNVGSPDREPPRTSSPFRKAPRPNLRSHHSLSSLTAPPMIRAHSSPTFHASQFALGGVGAGGVSPYASPLQRAASPLRSPRRARSPYREDGYFPSTLMTSGASGGLLLDIESIHEDEELEVTPRPFAPVPWETVSSPLLSGQGYHHLASQTHHTAAPRAVRRRPASPSLLGTPPIRRTASPTSLLPVPEQPTISSPLLSGTTTPQKYTADPSYRDIPELHHLNYSTYTTPSNSFSFRSTSVSSSASISSFSVPSTPTSARSRSPSISGLETIEDSPDAEEEALEAERVERIQKEREAAERALTGEEDDGGPPAAGGGLRAPGGLRDKRKRWSVCGGEKSSDLNLETIWED